MTDKLSNKFRVRAKQFVSKVDVHGIKSCIVPAGRFTRTTQLSSYKTNKSKENRNKTAIESLLSDKRRQCSI